MILDIRYWHKGPEQIRDVRMTTIYPDSELSKESVLVIHFQEYTKSSVWIELKEIQTITTTND